MSTKPTLRLSCSSAVWFVMLSPASRTASMNSSSVDWFLRVVAMYTVGRCCWAVPSALLSLPPQHSAWKRDTREGMTPAEEGQATKRGAPQQLAAAIPETAAGMTEAAGVRPNARGWLGK